MPDVISFANAIAAAPTGKKHVLLGNGFSRACRNDIFAYDALFDRADFAGLGADAKAVFAALGTKDFERVMRALREASAIARVYAKKDPGLAAALERDATLLREVLASAIASSHPARPNEIGNDRYAACRQFLSNFGDIYTVNYDLLLYWALMQNELAPQIQSDDGFRQPDSGPAEYVTWEVQNTDYQTVHYLHGALHIFDAGAEVQKFTWINTQIALIEQIRAALATNRYPLFVAEGTATEKMDRIQHSGLLNRSYRSFAKIKGSLFVYGLGMNDNDVHILRLIEDGGLKFLAVSLFGDPNSDANRAIVTRATGLAANRHASNPLTVRFFDAASAQVWGA